MIFANQVQKQMEISTMSKQAHTHHLYTICLIPFVEGSFFFYSRFSLRP